MLRLRFEKVRISINFWRTMVGGLMLLFAGIVPSITTAQPGPSTTTLFVSEEKYSISQLLQLLDGPTYAQREMATRQLIRLGDKALRPMAKHYLDASPESSWRIRKSLEEIGTSGDEAIFLKSVGLLQLLVGNSNAKLNEQLQRLKFEWLQNQTQTAISVLRSAGAVIDDLTERSVYVSQSTTPDSKNERRKRLGENLTANQKSAAIDKIVEGSLTANRKLVLGAGGGVKQDLAEKDEVINALERQLANRVIIRGGRPVNLRSKPGIVAKFGDTWKGNRQQFRQLENIRSLNQISFRNQYIDKFKLETLSELTSVQSLEFDKCRFAGAALATVGLPDFVQELRFRNQDIEVSTIDRISKLPVKSLLFDSCDFSPSAMKKLLVLSNVVYLELVNQTLTDSDFKRIKNLKSLASLKLSGTKFPFKAYKSLTVERPDLYVDFTTTAFLGVRSVQGLRDSCQISDVISGSGAEKGGVLVDDVIVRVDGHEIEQFNDLRAHIALHKAGDQLELTIRREDEIVNLQVKLGDYSDAPVQ